MKLVALLSFLAMLPFPLGLGAALETNNTLTKREKPLSCVSTWWGWISQDKCVRRDGLDLLMPDWWLFQAQKIDDRRWYGNYDKIICTPFETNYKVCAFIDGQADGDVKVPGWQVKHLFEHLADYCGRSRCGQCRVDQVGGPARTGWFKIDSVAQQGYCERYCKPWQS